MAHSLGRRIGPGHRLDPDALIRRAIDGTGLDDFGGDEFREPLGVLVESLESEAELSPLGRAIVRSRIADGLANRLRLAADRAAHPEIVRQPISAPVFIVGPPRTGTSILFHTLAQDPGTLTPLQWKLDFPSPPPPLDVPDGDRRLRLTRRRTKALYLLLPRLRPLYTVAPRLPNECVVITAHEFTSLLFSVTYRVPTYDAWLLQADHRSAYRFHRRFLQQLQWKVERPRWLLKSPGHLLSLDALFEEYPDARVIQTHREPLEALTSIASLTAILRSLSTERIDLRDVGAHVARFWHGALVAAQSFRERRRDLADRFLDVSFTEIHRQPVETIRRIYERLSWPLSAEAEARMRRHLASPRLGMRAPRVEDPARFGLEPRREAERFAGYAARLGAADA